jgi:hypothetical protein
MQTEDGSSALRYVSYENLVCSQIDAERGGREVGRDLRGE